MYATGPGTVITDTDSKSSLFVGELLKEMRPPQVRVEEVFNRTRSGVARASKSEQVPWISSSLLPTDELYFNRNARPVAAAPTATDALRIAVGRDRNPASATTCTRAPCSGRAGDRSAARLRAGGADRHPQIVE